MIEKDLDEFEDFYKEQVNSQFFKIKKFTNKFLQDIRENLIEIKVCLDHFLETGKEKILGTSIFPNSDESMLGKIQFDPFEDTRLETGQTKVLNLHRKAEPFEKLRLKTEKYAQDGGKVPTVFLLPVGNPAMSNARAIFSRNFFSVAGFEIQDNHTYDDLEVGIKEAIDSKAEIIVLCSSDEEYKDFGPPIANELRSRHSKQLIVIAGYPKDIVNELKISGITDFIHIKSNALETLKGYQEYFKIK